MHREDHRRASTTYESRVREVGEQVEEWKWRVKEEEKEKQEKDRELAQCRDMERTLRYVGKEGIRGGKSGIMYIYDMLVCVCVCVCLCLSTEPL